MIRKLRSRLVVATLCSLVAVLFVIMGAAALFNYRNILFDADETLAILVENDGKFPEATDFKDIYAMHFSEELPYETRFFTIAFADDGAVASVNTGKIAAVDENMAVEYALTALERGNTRGFVSDYRYILYDDDGETNIIFLDCGRQLDAFRTFLFNSISVSIGGVSIVIIILVFLSERIVKPFSENFEKQKQFITNAGHELKTPLTVIDADAEVLEMDIGKNEWLDDIQNQTKRLADLTNNLILLSRMDEERSPTVMIEFPLSDTVEETVETFQALAKTHNKSLTSTVQPMLSIVGEEKDIRRLVTILLDNAVKYSDDGGKINVKLEKQKNTVVLSVFNTAEYISRESLSRLFDRFYRADCSRNSKTGGYGLGLSIASAIVSTHKGTISASTQDERSLLITVRFPAQNAQKL